MSTAEATPGVPITAAQAGWIKSPAFDLLFLSVLLWIPLAGLAAFLGADHAVALQISMVNLFLLNTPHRWFTLVLVFLDRTQYAQAPRTYNGVLVGYAALGLLVYWVTGSWTLHVLSIFLWNKWHFAAQHHGILRIYGRLAGRQQDDDALLMERWLLRAFVMYTGMRLIVGYADYPGLWGEAMFAAVFPWLDYVALAVPVLLVWREVRLGISGQARGRSVYLFSVLAMYSTLIVAAHVLADDWVSALVLATAFFHSVEYLAICWWSLEKKKGRDPTGVWVWIMPRLGVFILTFMLVLFITGTVVTTTAVDVWIFLNWVVSLAHYTYDGMIWKKPKRAAPARVAA